MNATQPENTVPEVSRLRLGGMTLIELLVGLTIGSFLILGAVTVFMQGQSTYRVNESVARLQENARFALDALEPDIRMASYFGLTTRSGRIANRASPDDADGPGPDDCGQNWTIDLDRSVEGTNDAYTWGCAATGGAQAGTDTLVVRRAARDVVAPQAGRMYIQSWRLQPGEIFVGTPAPTTDTTSEVHELVVNGYYVSQTSSLTTADNTVPSLRRKRLATGPAITDEEVLPGIEDFQVQFGVDTDPVGSAGRGVVNRYVDPGAAIITPGSAGFMPDARILSVRIWVLARAERPELGYENDRTYEYAGVALTPNDGYRRALVSKTIYLRNARPAS